MQFNIKRTLGLVEDENKKIKLDLALNSIERHKNHCGFHYDEFKQAFDFHGLAILGQLPSEAGFINPEYYRCAFESHAFAFFRALHALIESVPYIVNILIGSKPTEYKFLNWNTVKDSLKEYNANFLITGIDELRKGLAYIQLNNLVNISKHRRLPRIDSGIFLPNGEAKFVNVEFDDGNLVEPSISDFMLNSHGEIVLFIITFISELTEHLKATKATSNRCD